MNCAYVARKSVRRQTTLVLVALLAASRLALGQTTASPLAHGRVSIGSYATVSQFKDLKVTAEGQVLLQKTMAEGLADFDLSGGGQWKVLDNVLQQSSTDAKGMNIFTGDQDWTDYIVSVMARKVTGKEGFSLGFRALDSKNFACLNVGGWNNTKAQFGITLNGTFSEIGDSTNMKVEEDRWYEVKVDVQDDQAIGYVDGQKVASAKLVPPPSKPAAANPSYNLGGPGAPRGNGGPPRGDPGFPGGPGGNPGRARWAVGGGGGSGYTPLVSTSEESSGLWDKVLLAGAVAVVTAVVVAGAMWLRGRLPKAE
jgi:hypothetical protein